MGYKVRVNRPYEGTLVPLPFWRKDRRVASIMIEVNRSLCMDEATGRKTEGFTPLKTRLAGVLSGLRVSAMRQGPPFKRPKPEGRRGG